MKNTIYDQEEVREMVNNHVEAEENAGNSNDQFVEWIEDYKPTSKTCRSWVLRSGTNVGEALLAYWNILDLTEDLFFQRMTRKK